MNNIIENWQRYLFVESKKESLNYESARIDIANEIDTTLMRPTVNIGDPNDMMIDVDEEGNMYERPFGKEDSTFLLYLYRGFDEDGNLANDENIRSVNSELDERARNFLAALEKEDLAVFLADADNIIEFVSGTKKKEEEASYQTMYMAKKAPGKFTGESFARRNRAIYKDTYTYGGGVDFMFKRTPELKNINPQHLFLFKIENLIGRIKNKILNGEADAAPSKKEVNDIVALSKTVPSMDVKSWHANYREGVTTKKIDQEVEQIKPVYQRGAVQNYFTFKRNELLRLLYNTHKQGKNAPIYNNSELMKTFFDTVQSHMDSLLSEEEKSLKERTYPSVLMRMSMMFDKGMIPREFFDEKNYKKFTDLKQRISTFNELDEYTFIFPLNPDEVPKEVRAQTNEKDVKDRKQLEKIRNQLEAITKTIKSNSTLKVESVESLFDLVEDVAGNQKEKIKKIFSDFNITTDDIINYLSKNVKKQKVKTGIDDFENKLQQLENVIYSDKEMPDGMFADFIKSMESLKTNNKLKTYSNRISKLFDYLEGK